MKPKNPMKLPRPSLFQLKAFRHLVWAMGWLFVVGAACFSFPALAQQLSLDLGDGGSLTGRLVQAIALVTVLTLAPSILVTMTSFTRIIIVLGLLRQALGAAQSPPNVVMVALALFLTGFIMTPTFTQSWNEGVRPYVDEEISEVEAFNKTIAPFHAFMSKHTRDRDLALFFEMSQTQVPAKVEDVPLQVLIPAFMISELKRAFEIGFLIFMPFLVIDMVVSSVLMAMGMMMLPPVMVSLPFKLIFFVLVDGWVLVVGSLVKSFTG